MRDCKWKMKTELNSMDVMAFARVFLEAHRASAAMLIYYSIPKIRLCSRAASATLNT